MGQMTYGIVYGVELPNNGKVYDEYDALIERYAGGDRPGWEAETRQVFIGYTVAAGASGREGSPYLESFQIDALDTDKRYTKSMERAAKRWAKFADWCEKQGVTLPEPHVWLREIEVA